MISLKIGRVYSAIYIHNRDLVQKKKTNQKSKSSTEKGRIFSLQVVLIPQRFAQNQKNHPRFTSFAKVCPTKSNFVKSRSRKLISVKVSTPRKFVQREYTKIYTKISTYTHMTKYSKFKWQVTTKSQNYFFSRYHNLVLQHMLKNCQRCLYLRFYFAE